MAGAGIDSGGGGTTLSGYTQTYSTADKTHAARTAQSLTDSTTGTASDTIEDVTGFQVSGGADSIELAQFNSDLATLQGEIDDRVASLVDEINKLRADQQDTAQVVNSIIDDLE